MSVPSPMVSSWSPLLLIDFLSKKCICPVLNCLFNLEAICLDDENKIPLKVIASFSALRLALSSIPLIVFHGLVRFSFWSMVSTKCINCFWFQRSRPTRGGTVIRCLQIDITIYPNSLLFIHSASFKQEYLLRHPIRNVWLTIHNNIIIIGL